VGDSKPASEMAALWEREIAAATARGERDDALLASAAAGGPFWGVGKPTVNVDEMQGLVPIGDPAVAVDMFRPALRRRIGVPTDACDAVILDKALAIADKHATLEHELAKADRQTAEQEHIIARRGEKLEAMRAALADALVLYDEKPSHGEWGGCLCPSRGHLEDCHRMRISKLRKLLDDGTVAR
jgi:hypothetical protein